MALNLKRSRRNFMSSLGVLGGEMLHHGKLCARSTPARVPQGKISGFGETGNVYEELGVTTVINGQGSMTMLGGSLMRPEVEAVMALGSLHFCSIPELEVAAAKPIGEMLKLPDRYTPLATTAASPSR